MPAGDPVSWADSQVPLAAWTSYTPTFTTSGGAASIGTGTIFGRYQKTGKLVKCIGYLIFGTGANGGSGGDFTMSLPFAVGSVGPWVGKCYLRDASATSVGHFNGIVLAAAGASLVTFADGLAHAKVNNTTPFSWTFGPPADFLAWQLTYESAV